MISDWLSDFSPDFPHLEFIHLMLTDASDSGQKESPFLC